MTTDKHPPHPADTADTLHALVDGQLPTDQQAAAHARLAIDPAALDTLHAWQAQREALRALHQPLLDEAVPGPMLAVVRRTQKMHQQRGQWARWGGRAAGIFLAFAVGWMAHGQWLGAPPQGQLSQNTRLPTFVQQASVAHAVFSPEVRHPVEVTAAQQDHLVQWLSKRLDRPLKVPVLAALGYELVGGRLLPGESGARAQFMFQNPAGQRVTLYLGALDAKTTGGAKAQPETTFRYSSDGPVPSFYWVDNGFGYALSGALSREELTQLAQLVHQQL